MPNPYLPDGSLASASAIIAGPLDVTVINPVIPVVAATVVPVLAVAPVPIVTPADVQVTNTPNVQVTNTPNVSVGNFPATQPVSGAVAVSNFPGTQSVSGTVAVSNLPGTQNVAVTNTPVVTLIATPLPVDASTETSVSGIDPYFRSGFYATISERAAVAYHIKGRRAGFSTINVNQDIAEFLGVTTDLLPELTGAETLEVVSSSASDTAAGTGTRTIRITYINSVNSLVQSPPITLNGLTAVVLGFSAKFIVRMEAATGGTSETSVGNIILRISPGGATHEQISAGQNNSLSCRFMVPTGYTAYIKDWQVTAIGGATQDARLRALVNDFDRTLGTRYIAQDLSQFVENSSVNNEIPWLKFPALSKIKASTITSAAGATNRVDADFSVVLIAD